MCGGRSVCVGGGVCVCGGGVWEECVCGRSVCVGEECVCVGGGVNAIFVPSSLRNQKFLSFCNVIRSQAKIIHLRNNNGPTCICTSTMQLNTPHSVWSL